jgi:hypothetical protein
LQEGWNQFVSLAEPDRAFEIAQQLASVCRTLTSLRTVPILGPANQDPRARLSAG